MSFLRSLSLRTTPPMRLALMASHLSTTSSPAARSPSLSALPKSHTFTSSLPPDPQYPTPESSHAAPRGDLLPRMVKGGLYTFVRPTKVDDPELLAVSPAALRDLNISEDAVKDGEFVQIVSGSRVLGWEDVNDGGEGKEVKEDDKDSAKAEIKYENGADNSTPKLYPWAQNYGGFQFGQWASQLGDGRALSLFETTNPVTGVRYEVQLKGAGKTPYSRFADGRAVLRASIREFIVSEALNALGIRSTRALSLVRAPKLDVFRERIERGAIVCRFAESWLRIGTFDLLRARGERKLIRQLADYAAKEVFGGWDKLPAALPEKHETALSGEQPKVALNGLPTKDDSPYDHLSEDQILNPPQGIESTETQDKDAFAQNRYTRLYRHIVRLNAATVAKWQLYGFTNGVLNTDNTSIAGLSLDFGPFSFIDNYEPSFTPNHDDHSLRYSYRNQPSIIWWNLVRLGEDLGELLGTGPRVDEEAFITGGIKEEDVKEVQERGENLIMRAGEEYKAVFMAEYKRGMTARLGLKSYQESDFSGLFSEWLDILEAGELDFNHSFRRLGGITMEQLETEKGREERAGVFFKKEEKPANGEAESRKRIAEWLDKWRNRITADWGEGKDEERKRAMDSVNPKFIPRNWILDELIQRVDKKGERDIINNIMTMALDPFADEWGWDREEEERFCGDVPKYMGGLQCSCSS